MSKAILKKLEEFEESLDITFAEMSVPHPLQEDWSELKPLIKQALSNQVDVEEVRKITQKIFKEVNQLYGKSAYQKITSIDCLDVETNVCKYIDEIEKLLTTPQPTLEELRDEIKNVLTPHYENWYMDFGGIEIDETGIYAIVNDYLDGRARFIIYKVIEELEETSVCRHLENQHILMCAKYFERLESESNG